MFRPILTAHITSQQRTSKDFLLDTIPHVPDEEIFVHSTCSKKNGPRPPPSLQLLTVYSLHSPLLLNPFHILALVSTISFLCLKSPYKTPEQSGYLMDYDPLSMMQWLTNQQSLFPTPLVRSSTGSLVMFDFVLSSTLKHIPFPSQYIALVFCPL